MPDDRVRDLWFNYWKVCLATKGTDRYELAEPLAYRELQQELRKLKTKAKAAA